MVLGLGWMLFRQRFIKPDALGSRHVVAAHAGQHFLFVIGWSR